MKEERDFNRLFLIPEDRVKLENFAKDHVEKIDQIEFNSMVFALYNTAVLEVEPIFIKRITDEAIDIFRTHIPDFIDTSSYNERHRKACILYTFLKLFNFPIVYLKDLEKFINGYEIYNVFGINLSKDVLPIISHSIENEEFYLSVAFKKINNLVENILNHFEKYLNEVRNYNLKYAKSISFEKDERESDISNLKKEYSILEFIFVKYLGIKDISHLFKNVNY